MTRTKLLSNIKYSLQCIEWPETEEKEIKKAFEKLKKDLRSLNPLQKENKKLINKNVRLSHNNFNLENVILYLKDRHKKLEKENQELKEYNGNYQFLYENTFNKLQEYKKAIEILKRGFTVRLEKLEPHYHIVICGNIRKLTQQEYELLQEVLGYE